MPNSFNDQALLPTTVRQHKIKEEVGQGKEVESKEGSKDKEKTLFCHR